MHKGLQTTCNGRVLFLDMNSFFASVEQQYEPRYRDRPLAVVSHLAPRATVLAASYEAKAFGIRTGTRLAEAKQLCPDVIAIETSAGRYREIHEKFMTILRDLYGPEVIPRSIDEAAIFLAPNHYGSEYCLRLARTIKERFKAELGEYIRCSIGIAPNMLLAKVASNLKKPDGLTEITLENLESVLASMQLTDLPGIAQRSAARLFLHGIQTPLDLYNTPAQHLQKWFGIWGQYWWWRLHGYEADGAGTLSKSISHEHVLTRWVHSLEAARPIMLKMTDRLIYRLRRNQFQCRSVWIYARLANHTSLFAEASFDSPTASYVSLLETVSRLFSDFPPPEAPIKKLCVCFEGLEGRDHGMQLDLFDERRHYEGVSQAVEDIRRRFGFNALHLASTMTLGSGVAKEQLGFGRIKDRYATKP